VASSFDILDAFQKAVFGRAASHRVICRELRRILRQATPLATYKASYVPGGVCLVRCRSSWLLANHGQGYIEAIKLR
jgi:hypothetical protein